MLWHDPTGGCLYATWQGKHPSWSTQVQYLLIQQHLRATGSTKLLNDSLLDEDGWSEAAGWVAEHGFRYLAEAGLQAVAWVLPRQPAAFYDTARVLAQLHQPLVDTFTEAQAAYDWLHRWPAVRSVATGGGAVGSAAAFRLLPPAQQVTLAAQQGRALVSHWEAAYYVQPYELANGLRVDVFYHVHSGVVYQVQVHQLP